MDHLSHFVSQYGYWAVAAGCLLEGETVMVLTGLAARRGLLDLPLVMALGPAMGALGDIAMFSLGRWRGAAVLARGPRLLGYQERLNRLLARWGAGVVVGVRVMYGMRIAGPILLGMSDLPWPRFLAFNLVGAALTSAGRQRCRLAQVDRTSTRSATRLPHQRQAGTGETRAVRTAWPAPATRSPPAPAAAAR